MCVQAALSEPNDNQDIIRRPGCADVPEGIQIWVFEFKLVGQANRPSKMTMHSDAEQRARCERPTFEYHTMSVSHLI